MKLALLIISWGWILLGIWWFFRPSGIKKRFEKHYRKNARWLLLTIFIFIAGILFSTGWEIGGIWGTLLAILGAIAVLKALLFIRGAASEKVLEWWHQQPTWVYRAAAAGLLILGCLVQAMLKWKNSG